MPPKQERKDWVLFFYIIPEFAASAGVTQFTQCLSPTFLAVLYNNKVFAVVDVGWYFR